MDGLPKGNDQMYAGTKVLSRISKLFAAVGIGSTFAFSPVNAEKIYSKVTKEEAQNLSSALKTFICLGERLAPDWCEDFRNFKLTPRKPVVDLAEKSAADVKSGPQSLEQQIANQPDLENIPSTTEAEVVKVVALKVVEPVIVETPREKEFKAFLGTGNFTKLTAEQLELVVEMAVSNSHPKANEILGFAYTNGSGVVGKSKVKAYRQYGIAYLKGLVRVKPNMDVLWKKFSRSEQFSLVHEFKRLKKEAKYISTSMNN